MSTKAQKIKEWEEHCQFVQQFTSFTHEDTPAEKRKRIKKAKSDFGFFVQEYFPHYAEAPSPPFHLKAANWIKANPRGRCCLNWYRSAAKSVFADIMMPMWLKINGELKFMMLIGSNADTASFLLADLQAELQNNQRFIRDFGEQYNHGHWQNGAFSTKDGCHFKSIGMGQDPRGSRRAADRPDYVVLDDLDSLELSLNPSRITKLFNWIKRAVLGMFKKGNARVVVPNNEIADDGIMPRLAKLKGWKEFRVPMLSKYPEAGGIPAWPGYHTYEYCMMVADEMGMSEFLTEYQLQPTFEGKVFKKELVRWLHVPQKKILSWVAYIDPSWADSSNSCHQAVSIWGKYLVDGIAHYHLEKVYMRQGSTKDLAEWCYDYQESLPEDMVIRWLIEANFMQGKHLNEFKTEGIVRKKQLRITGDKRSKGNKEARIGDLLPLYERKWITHESRQKEDPDMVQYMKYMYAWEGGSKIPNDGLDASEGALYILERTGVTSTAGIRIGKRSKTGRSRI